MHLRVYFNILHRFSLLRTRTTYRRMEQRADQTKAISVIAVEEQRKKVLTKAISVITQHTKIKCMPKMINRMK